METPIISMQASRCPDATVQMRKLVRVFAEQPQMPALKLETIEPSLIRSLPAFIAAEELPINVTLLGSREITTDDYAIWSKNFDEDDYSDVSVIQCFVLEKHD